MKQQTKKYFIDNPYPNYQYTCFISNQPIFQDNIILFYPQNTMHLSDITHAKLNSQQNPLELTCDLEGDKIIVQALCDNVRYQGERQLDPDIDFEDIKESILNRHYKIVNKTPEILKLKIAFLNLQLKNKEAKLINDLQKNVSLLTDKTNTLSEENTLLRKITKDLKGEIDLLVTKISDLAEIVNKTQTTAKQLSTENLKLKKQLDQSQQKITRCEAEHQKIRILMDLHEKRLQQAQQNIENYNEKHKKTAQDLLEQIKQLSQIPDKLSALQEENNSKFACLQPLLYSPKVKLNELSMHSYILSSQEEQTNLQGFFDNKKIASMQLLYRASDNKFLIKRFHDTCDGIPKTLILCETEFGKIIGGYTPLCWQSKENENQDKYQQDEDKQSFVFSLTNNDKIQLNDSAKAIRNDRKMGPVFGCSDFEICDKAKEDNSSWAFINCSYTSEKYSEADQTSKTRFVGDSQNSSNFKVSEWEVWRVEFKQGDDVSENDTYRSGPASQSNQSDKGTYRSGEDIENEQEI